MCFAPQRRALFRHLNFRTWCVLYILTSKCASRHNCVHFFDIATSKSGPNLVCFAHFDFKMCFAPQRRAIFHHSSGWLRTRRFSEPTFRPGATNHWKNTVFRDFPTFSRNCIFFLLTLSLLLFFLLIFLFSLPLPCSAFHIVGSLTSKLPSINLLYHFICLSTESFRFFRITRGCVPLTLIKPQERPTSSLSKRSLFRKTTGALGRVRAPQRLSP